MSVGDFIKELYPPYKRWLVQTDTFGDEIAISILKNKDVAALARLFRSIPTNWADRYFYSLAMSRHFPLKLLKGWAESEQSSADAHLVYGARLLKWSWDARGYGRGQDISQKQWAEFFRRLEMTREALLTCADLLPEDPTPWAYLIMVAVYNGDGEEVERAYFEQAIQRDGNSWIAHMHRLTGLTEKYGGSHAQMFKFAYETASKAEQGTLLPALILKAHSEYWKYLAYFDGDYPAAENYSRKADLHEETVDIYQRSLGSNSYEKREALFARINAAGWFWIVQQREILQCELRQLEGSIDAVHWRWVGTEPTFSKARQFAGI